MCECVCVCVSVFWKPTTAWKQCHSLCVLHQPRFLLCMCMRSIFPFLINTLWIINMTRCHWDSYCCNWAHLFIYVCKLRVHLYVYFLKFDVLAYQHITTRNSYFIYLFYFTKLCLCSAVWNGKLCVCVCVGYATLHTVHYNMGLIYDTWEAFARIYSQFHIWFMLMLYRFLITILFSKVE